MKRLTKSSSDRVLSGVCAGIAEFFGITPFLIRLIFFFVPVSPVLYVILAEFLPEDNKSLY